MGRGDGRDLKYFDGSVGAIDRVPDDLKALYATAFEIDSAWLVEAAARRQKWLDQAQSLNLYIARAHRPNLNALYRLAWERGLKTTYYLRSRSAPPMSRNRRSTALTAGSMRFPHMAAEAAASRWGKACAIDDPTCEACQ